MKNHFVVTGFDDIYWATWGKSWLISLKEFAKHDPEQIIIVGYNLSANSKSQILNTGAVLLPAIWSGYPRQDTIKAITEMACKKDGIYAYWDADVYFQESIEEVFNLAKEDFIVSKNLNQGFLAGPHHQWVYLNDIQNITQFFGDSDIMAYLFKFLGNMERIEDTWNFLDMPKLKDVNGKLTNKDEIQKVIHPAGIIKTFLKNKNILFWERHKTLFDNYFTEKKHGSRRLITKNRLHTNDVVVNNNK